MAGGQGDAFFSKPVEDKVRDRSHEWFSDW